MSVSFFTFREALTIGLLLENFLDLSDLFLDRAGDLFILAFRHQVRIVGHFAYFCLEFALHFMKLALSLIVRTGFHFLFSPSHFEYGATLSTPSALSSTNVLLGLG